MKKIAHSIVLVNTSKRPDIAGEEKVPAKFNNF